MLKIKIIATLSLIVLSLSCYSQIDSTSAEAVRPYTLPRWKVVALVNKGIGAEIFERLSLELVAEIDTLTEEALERENSFRSEMKAERGIRNTLITKVDAETSLRLMSQQHAKRYRNERNILASGVFIYIGIRILVPLR